MWRRKLILLACLLLWALSLIAPAVEITGGPTLHGADLLQQGASGWRQGVLAWYANPLLLIAVAGSWFRFERAALVAGALGILLALSSFWAGATARLAGATVPGFSYQWGFYVWICAQAAVFIVVFQRLIVKKRSLDRK